MTRFTFLAACALVAVLNAKGVCAQPAAQPAGAPPAKPVGPKPDNWGLFGGGSKDQPHSLDVNAEVSGVYDDNLAAQVPGNPNANSFLFDPRYTTAGYGYGFSGNIAYAVRKAGRRDSIRFDANAGLHEFSGGLGDPIWMRNLGASATYGHDFTPKVTMRVSGGIGESPYYQYAPFIQGTVTDISPAGKDAGFGTNAPNVLRTTAAISAEDRFSKRSSVSLAADIDHQDAPELGAIALDRRTIRGGFSHNILKQLAVTVGYRVERIAYANSADEPYLNHGLDIGLGYGDGITVKLGRYYTLSLGIGTTVARNGSARYVEGQAEYRFLANGHATLDRSIGRSWNASVGFVQDTQYVLGLLQPLYTSTASAGVSGPIADKLNFSAGIGAARGQQIFSTTSSGGALISYNGSARLTYAIFSNLGLYGQASYYKYETPSDFNFPLFLPNLERRSISVGLSTWLPLIKAPRRARTSEPQGTGQP